MRLSLGSAQTTAAVVAEAYAIMQVDQHIDLARERPLTLEDAGLGVNPHVEAVREFCDAFAQCMAERFVSRDLSWPEADAIANHYYGLMIQHCGAQMPDYAWEVYLAFDEAEIDDRGDAFTRRRLAEIQMKYGRP